jgi:hypothetical protein
MKTYKFLVNASLLAAVSAACSMAGAGTLSGGSTTHNGVSAITNPPKITAAGQIVQVKHSFGVDYYGPDKNAQVSCNAKLEYSDGEPSEMVSISYPAEGVARMRKYTKPGKYSATLTGMAYNGKKGCLSSATANLTIEDGMPANLATSMLGTSAVKPPVRVTDAGTTVPPAVTSIGGLPSAPAPFDIKANITKITLRDGSVFPLGMVALTSTVELDKPDNNCLMEFKLIGLSYSASYTVKRTGTFENNRSAEYVPGFLNFLLPGKFRFSVYPDPAAPSHCTGTASTEFEIKDFRPPVAAASAPAASASRDRSAGNIKPGR